MEVTYCNNIRVIDGFLVIFSKEKKNDYGCKHNLFFLGRCKHNFSRCVPTNVPKGQCPARKIDGPWRGSLLDGHHQEKLWWFLIDHKMTKGNHFPIPLPFLPPFDHFMFLLQQLRRLSSRVARAPCCPSLRPAPTPDVAVVPPVLVPRPAVTLVALVTGAATVPPATQSSTATCTEPPLPRPSSPTAARGHRVGSFGLVP